ncbi:response regulator, partial [bacterium]|nr:response regulator [bacterium]
MEREPTSYRILAIDDEKSILDNYRDFLEDIGYTVFIAQDSQTALKLFKNEMPDAVICDLRMPEIDGLQLLELFKKDIPNIPFIFISGTRDFNHVIQALRQGATDYLMKPILEMETLDHRIRKALERAELEAQNQAYSEYLEDMVEQRTAELQRKSEELESINKELRLEMEERAIAEDQVRHSQSLLREVIDNVPYFISALD